MNRKICYYLDEVDALRKGDFLYPVTCEIDPSNFCQNRCRFCINDEYIVNNRCNLDYNLYGFILYQLRDAGVKSITLTGGGEPLMNPDINRMIQLASDLGFEVGLITNGINLDKFDLMLLPSLKFIRVSLDAATAETYEKIKRTNYFNKVVQNIYDLSEYGEHLSGFTLGISFVVCEENKHESEEAVHDLFKDCKGISYIQVKPVIADNMEELEDKSEFMLKTIVTPRYNSTGTLACDIAGLVGNIAATGELYYCCVHRGDPNFYIGDLNEESFADSWEKRTNFKPDISLCTACRYMNYVKGYEEFSHPKYSFLRHKRFL